MNPPRIYQVFNSIFDWDERDDWVFAVSYDDEHESKVYYGKYAYYTFRVTKRWLS